MHGFLLLSALAGFACAAVTPLAPGPGNSFREGAACGMQYALDTTGTWTNMTIDLMTGSNFVMSVVANVATGIDGTTGDGTYSWTCPDVTPNSAIYFYQFSLGGRSPTWTTRFTIAAANGDVTAPEFSTQPGASGVVAIPYGIGRLASGAVVVPSGSTSRVATGAASGTSIVSLGPLTSLGPLPTATSAMATSVIPSSSAAVVTRSSSAVVVATSTQPSVVPAATTSAAAVVRSSGEIVRAGSLLSLVFGFALLA